jgi:hypothetical protein
MRTVGATQGFGSSTVARILEFPVLVAGKWLSHDVAPDDMVPLFGNAAHSGTEGRLIVGAAQLGTAPLHRR